MKVTSYNDNTRGTVMTDQMAHHYHLNTKLESQQKKLQEQINIATKHNNQQKETNYTTDIKKKPKQKSKNLSVNSVDSDEPTMKMVSETKKLKSQTKNLDNKSKIMISESKKRKRDKFKNYDLTVQVYDKVIHKKIKVPLTKPPKKDKPKNNSKNMDEEEDEKDYVWEIDRDWKLPYYRRQKYKKPKQKTDLEVMGLENYRKREGYEGELLVHFKDGRRDWAPACACKKDAKAKMYNDALKRFNLTNEQLEYGLSKKQIVPIEQKGKEEHFE